MTASGPPDSIGPRSILLFREALRDNNENFTCGPVRRALALLAIPLMLDMAMESVFAIVDIAFVWRLGADAVAAVGITEALVTVSYGNAIGLGMGLTGMVARRAGEKDTEPAALVTGQSIWIDATLSVAIGVTENEACVCRCRRIGIAAHGPGRASVSTW